MTYEDLEELTELKGLPYVLGLLANIAEKAAEYEMEAGPDPSKSALWSKQAKVLRQSISDIERVMDEHIAYGN